MDSNFGLIGVGNAGGQIVEAAHKKYPDLFGMVAINSSQSDLAMIHDDVKKFKIGPADYVEGSGKNRTKMKEYLQESIEKLLTDKDFMATFENRKFIFIISSTAGGTGSGASPVLYEILRQAFPDIHFVLVMVLPKIQDSLADQGNTLEYLQELYTTLSSDTTYMVYDNETTSDKSPTEALTVVNENIVEDLRVLTGIDNYATPYESIDWADMESIITTSGRLLVTRVTKNLTEKNMEDASFDDIIIKSIKSSCHCETDRNKKVVRWGIITYFTEEVNSLYMTKLEKLSEFIGTPDERFNHNAVHSVGESSNFLYLIASGLSPINDRANKIKQRIQDIKNKLSKDDNNYVLSEDPIVEDALELRKREVREEIEATAFKPKDVFAKFMKK